MSTMRLHPLLFVSFIVAAQLVRSEHRDSTYKGLPRSKYSEFHEAEAVGRFKCNNEEKIITWEQVNDDFCDCGDGSDEPGTSACVAGTFYCINRGHIGRYLPSSRVNDGICDCCDGTDEYSTETDCENSCEAEAAESRQQQAKRIKELEQGARIKKQMVEDATLALRDYHTRMEDINNKVEEKQRHVEVLTTEIEEVEKAELEAWVSAMKTEDNGKIAEMSLNSLNDQILKKILLVLARITNSDDLLGELLEAHSSGKDLYDIVVQHSSDSAQSKYPKDADFDEDGDYAYDDDDMFDELDDSDTDDDFAFVKDRPQSIIPAQYRSDKGNGLRRNLEDAIEELEDEEYKLQREKEKEGRDYGENNEFWALRDQCFNAKIQKYEYKICMYKKASQIEDGSEVTLGKWQGLAPQPTDLKDGKEYYEVGLKFGNGQKCWNGPNRSVYVFLSCGTENKVLSVEEPEICTYHATMTTPAACSLSHAEGINFDLLEEIEVLPS